MKSAILHINTLLLLGCIIIIQNCTSSNTSGIDLEELASSSAKDKNMIVRQTGTTQPAISKYPRQHWVDVRKDSKNPITRLEAVLASGDWDVAEEEARALLLKQPKNQTALSVLATALAMQRKYSLASFYARTYERYNSETTESLNLRALAKLSSNKISVSDFKEAADLFQKSMDLSSKEIAAGLNLGHLYLQIGDSDNAALVFSEVKSRCGDCLPALLGTGIALGRQENFRGAREHFEAVLKLHPHHAQALYRLALISYIGEHNLERAKSYLDELSTYAPEDQGMIRQKAEALVRALDAEGRPELVAKAKSNRKEKSIKSSEDLPQIDGDLLDEDDDGSIIKANAGE